ncbi:hypothetical protein Tco_0878577 [Tanacetum coccineum]|uniref:Uncharacterized protein n=1 Tax=Tanacetum coccineum TaxID=301880 RepID=A0ABQ5BYP5_9ASTR
MFLRRFSYASDYPSRWLWSHSVTIYTIPDSTPLSVGSLDIPAINFSDEDIEMQNAGLACKDVEVPSPRDDEAHFSHDILSSLPHPDTQRHLDGLSLNELANFHDVSALKCVISRNMLNIEAQSLSIKVSRLHNEVVSLRNQRADSTIMISRLEAKLLGVEGKLATREDSIIRDLKVENE